MITKNTYIPKGTPLLFFNQPEIAPINLIVFKSKKKGEESVRCYEVGKNKTKTRLYTIEKLKNMKGYDEWKTQSPIEIESYKETRLISIEKGNFTATFTLSFEAESDNNKIYVYESSFEITSIVVSSSVLGVEIVRFDISDILLDLICNDNWIEVLEQEIQISFAGGCYEITP